MAVDSQLLEKLEAKLNLSRRQVNRRISERAGKLFLPREQAAIALALESGVTVSRIATAEDFAAVRQAAANQAPAPAAPVPERPPAKKPARKPSARTTRRSSRRRGKKVFVVHGRDEEKRRAMFSFLRAIGLDPIEWGKAIGATKKGSPYVGEILDKAFKDAAAVVIMLTADEQARLKKGLARKSDPSEESRLQGQSRPNVLFEAGMAFGSHPEGTVLVQIGEHRPFSDVAGRHIVHLDDHAESRQDLTNRLSAIGCAVDLEGTDWLKEGRFGN